MRSRIHQVLYLFGWLVLLWAGCSGRARAPGALEGSLLAADEACLADADCQTGFCDRNVCVDLFEKGKFGGACDPHPAIDGQDAGPLDPGCGKYLCLAGRCRSCTSDAECQSTFGAGKCVPWNLPYLPARKLCYPIPKRKAAVPPP